MLLFENNIFIVCVVSVLTVWSCGASKEIIFDTEIQPFEYPLRRVLLCLDHNQLIKHTQFPKDIDLRFKLMDSFPDLNIEFHPEDGCTSKIETYEYFNPIAAIIAPKPFKLSSNIPMYFYDNPYPADEDNEEIPKFYVDVPPQEVSKKVTDVDAFPNGLFPLRDHWQSLKYVISHYITTHGWKRVAIVSDDSYYSQAIEEKLVEHFKERELVHTAQRCVRTVRGCNFDKAMWFLNHSDHKAFIIIVNIQKANAKSLLNARPKLASNKHVWIVRDWPFEETDVKSINHMVSLKLSPHSGPNYSSFAYDGPHLNSVWRGLSLINFAIEQVPINNVNNRLDKYYKAIYNMMNTTNKCVRSRVFIRKFTSGKPVYVRNTTVQVDGHIDPYKKDPELAEIADWNDYCVTRSKSFEDPCFDTWIVVICVVWLMFIIMVILLVFFFNRCLVWT